MSPILFWTFVAIMLFFAGMVVLNRNPVASALSLVVSFMALAALYVSLDAYFIGVIQILVYAGAVMVLFLCSIMLLGLKGGIRTCMNFTDRWRRLVVILLVLKFLSGGCCGAFGRNWKLRRTAQARQGGAWQVGMLIFERYNRSLYVVG